MRSDNDKDRLILELHALITLSTNINILNKYPKRAVIDILCIINAYKYHNYEFEICATYVPA